MDILIQKANLASEGKGITISRKRARAQGRRKRVPSLCAFAPLRDLSSADLEWEKAGSGVYFFPSEVKRVVRNPQRCNHKLGIGPPDIRWCAWFRLAARRRPGSMERRMTAISSLIG